MKFNNKINAPATKVWQVLFNDSTYREWTKPFYEGSYAVTDWKEGSRVHFLGPDGSGMYSEITTARPNEYMAIKHIGEVKNFEEQPLDEAASYWSGSMEIYRLTENNGVTDLEMELETSGESKEEEHLLAAFPPAMEIVKKLSENPVPIRIETRVNNSIDKIWDHWTLPEHITKWNNASDDWHSPSAENDLKPGGKFNFRMEAKDGSFGFDFEGAYTDVMDKERLEYAIVDGRKVKIDFINDGDSTKIIETFEAENENPLDLQQGGWQAILNNFKKYSEANK